MNFETSIEHLLSLGNEVETMKLGLENITALLSALGEPQTKYKKVQVAGTNGKGSVCAFLDSICREAKIRTGLYTSPHLISITERIKIGGIDISKEEFARLATRVRATAEELLADGRLTYRPTFFEQVTAIALLAFAEAEVELAILETGLGGRYDAVTAAKAEVAAITRIDLDHQEYLGDTIEEIAAEKAAIIGTDTRSVVVGPQSSEARKVIEKRVADCSCEASYLENSHSLQFGSEPLRLGLRGRHQIENASIAIEAVRVLGEQFSTSDDAIRSGLENAKHPGRLERIGRFLVDGAHNPSGARALRAYLDEFVSEPITLIFGAMKDKDVREILETLLPCVEKIIFTKPSNPRATEVLVLVRLSHDYLNARTTLTANSVEEAIAIAQRETDADGVILITGSLYLVGEVRRILKGW